MSHEKNPGGLDRFRLPAALLVVAIHVSPLSALSPEADFFLTRVLARLAVPFFFLVTGYFVLGDRPDPARVRRFLGKIGLLYGFSILLYLPFGIYAGHYERLTVSGLLRMLLFDGTFYHLWYFPACILGLLLVSSLCHILPRRAVAATAGLLYLAGLLGDSYHGLAASVPALKALYGGLFRMSSFTRNGLFFAPLYLVLGAQLASGRDKNAGRRPVSRTPSGSRKADLCGFAASFVLMGAEAFLLRALGLPRHDSMYLFLVPASVFLFRLLLSWDCRPAKRLRAVSAWIYVLHPAVLILLRMAARPLGLTKLLVEDPLIQFLSVAALSTAASFAAAALSARLSAALSVRRRGAGRRAVPEGSAAPDAPAVSDTSVRPAGPVSRDIPASSKGTAAFGRRAWIELDQRALRHNVRYLESLLPEGCRLMPAVKANAYGHGAVLIAGELARLGIDAFCVACAAEGVKLRKHGITGEILILGYTHPSQFPLLVRYGLTQTVVDASYGALLNAFGKKLHVHVGIDTGMHRLGERSENLDRLQSIWQMEHLVIDGVFTHLCTADGRTEREVQYGKEQAEAFYRTVQKLEEAGCACPNIHLHSSYGILRYPEYSGDHVRPGIALYGILSNKEDSSAWGASLRPVLSLKARIGSVRDLHPGESAGYGIAYTAGEERTLAVLSVGYADGLPRSFSCGKASVLINGRRAPILGRICMDQTLVDVTGIPGVEAGGHAVLIGSWGEETVTACDWAEAAGTITNEILSRLGGRLERMYRKENEGLTFSQK